MPENFKFNKDGSFFHKMVVARNKPKEQSGNQMRERASIQEIAREVFTKMQAGKKENEEINEDINHAWLVSHLTPLEYINMVAQLDQIKGYKKTDLTPLVDALKLLGWKGKYLEGEKKLFLNLKKNVEEVVNFYRTAPPESNNPSEEFDRRWVKKHLPEMHKKIIAQLYSLGEGERECKFFKDALPDDLKEKFKLPS